MCGLVEPASPVLALLGPPRFRGFRFACAESAPPHNRTFSLKWTLPPSWRNTRAFVVVSGTALDARVSSAGSKRAEGCSIVFEFCNTAMNADAAKPAADFSSDAVAKAGYANNYNGSTPSRYDPVNPTYRTGPTLDMGGRPLIGGGSHLNYYKDPVQFPFNYTRNPALNLTFASNEPQILSSYAEWPLVKVLPLSDFCHSV